MSFDGNLPEPFRSVLSGRKGISEKRMMGGICFFHHGNMLGGASQNKDGTTRFMFRVGKDNQDEALGRPGAGQMVLGRRRMGGLIYVDEKNCDEDAMCEWIELVFDFVGDLPPK